MIKCEVCDKETKGLRSYEVVDSRQLIQVNMNACEACFSEWGVVMKPVVYRGIRPQRLRVILNRLKQEQEESRDIQK